MDRISLFEIKIFLTVAKYKNFSKAAESLYVAQPTITKWIQHLEKELQVKLFDRTSKSVTLTPAGVYLYEKWSTLYDEFTLSKLKALAIAGAEPSVIHIGALYGYDYDKYLSESMSQFEAAHPNITLDFNIYSLSEMQQQMHNFDIIFTINFETIELTTHDFIRLDDVPFFLAVSKKHPLARKKAISIHEIEDEHFLIFPPEISVGATQYAGKAFQEVGIAPQFVPVRNTPSQLMKIAQNKGVAVAGKPVIKGYEQEISLIHLKDFSLEMYRVMAYNPKKITSAGKAFCEYIRKEISH